MAEEAFLVLRASGMESMVGSRGGFDFGSGLEAHRGIVDPSELAFRVQEEALNPKDFQDLQRDPEVQIIARPIPLQLIAPVEEFAAPAETMTPDPIADATWGVYVTGALHSDYKGLNVTVAVLDTGIDANHEAFQGVELVQKDFTGEGNGDTDGHGTHVAGTIFGQQVGSIRYGVATGVRRALIGKVLGKKRTATTTELVQAIQWAAAQGAHVINMSLGYNFPALMRWWIDKEKVEFDIAASRALAQYRDNIRLFESVLRIQQAMSAFSSGALVVAAAGNESKRQIRPDYVLDVSPPAASEGVVSVAALQTSGAPHEQLTVAPFSNVRAMLAAPGVGIYSARANSASNAYTYSSGTSMASPHVTGIAALWAERLLDRDGEVNAAALAAALRGSVRDTRLPGTSRNDVGAGLVTAPTL